MFRKITLSLFIIFSLFTFSTQIVLASHPNLIGDGGECEPSNPNSNHCIKGFSCQPHGTVSDSYLCQKDPFGEVFGKVEPPDALKKIVGNDPTGAGGISIFLSNLITLFYSIAAIVLIFMLLWGAWDWIISEGEKEKIHGAQQKIISAIIGIILFAITFALIRVLGKFTGFTFFVGQ